MPLKEWDNVVSAQNHAKRSTGCCTAANNLIQKADPELSSTMEEIVPNLHKLGKRASQNTGHDQEVIRKTAEEENAHRPVITAG